MHDAQDYPLLVANTPAAIAAAESELRREFGPTMPLKIEDGPNGQKKISPDFANARPD